MPKQSRKRSGSASSPRRRAASKKPAAQPAAQSAARSRSPKILVVDDEADQRTVIYHSLRVAGYSVSEAADGEKALDMIRRTKFDLVVLDIMMPRMSGYEVLERIRAMPSRAQTPVIVVTAKHDPDGVAREIGSGAIDHIAKPFLPSELETVVDRVLKGSKDEVEQGRRKLERSAEVYGTVGELHRRARDET